MNGSQSSAQSSLRSIAARVIAEVIYDQRSLSTCLDAHIQALAARDQAFVMELVYGCCRYFFALQRLCIQQLNKPLPKRFKLAMPLLVVGLYQLGFMRVPAHAALNETVSSCDELGLKPLKGLVNAVLRKLERSPTAFDAIVEHCADTYPQWFVAKLKHNWPEHCAAILEQGNLKAPMCLRVNLQKITREDYLNLLSKAGSEASAGQHSVSAIYLRQAQAVGALPGFDEGLCSVQDEAAQLCTSLLDLKSQQRVLDACAAPGGKTCAILEKQTQLSVHALEIDATRAQRIQENLDRLSLKATVSISAAEHLEQWWDGTLFDRILLDAPCSATGVIRRHPDIKLLRKPEDIKQLADLQLKMLSQLWKTLASDGKLLYATCSVFSQENSRIIERFLDLEPSAYLEPIDATWGIDTGFGRQLFPDQYGHDGFFYACLGKRQQP